MAAIDPLGAEDMSNLAALLHVNQKRIYEAIDAVGPRIADIQRCLKENPVTVKPRSGGGVNSAGALLGR